jgi:hypothetical protein
MVVERATKEDFPEIHSILANLDNKKEVFENVYEGTVNPDSKQISFVAKIRGMVIGCYVISKDVNLDYYKSHFHIQDSILLNEHERKAHSRLTYSVLNPIFDKSTRFILKELLRLSSNTCLYFEIHTKTVIP